MHFAEPHLDARTSTLNVVVTQLGMHYALSILGACTFAETQIECISWESRFVVTVYSLCASGGTRYAMCNVHFAH